MLHVTGNPVLLGTPGGTLGRPILCACSPCSP